MAYASVHAVSTREYDETIGVDVVRGLGYRATAPDGWRGPFRRRYSDASLDAYEYNRRAERGDASIGNTGAEAAPAARETGA